jgi:hypothetical protein
VHRDAQLADHVVKSGLGVENEDDRVGFFEREVELLRVELAAGQIPHPHREERAARRDGEEKAKDIKGRKRT